MVVECDGKSFAYEVGVRRREVVSRTHREGNGGLCKCFDNQNTCTQSLKCPQVSCVGVRRVVFCLRETKGSSVRSSVSGTAV